MRFPQSWQWWLALSALLLPIPSPWAALTTGQNAQTVLSAPGFDNAGYLEALGDGLLFNHPGCISADGTHLLLADTRNNRVLIWNTLPTSNASPDIVLGQSNLTSNDSGAGAGNLNWPVCVSASGGKIAVADTYNNRILIWNSYPTQNGQSPDLMISNLPSPNNGSGFSGAWPWAVWTNGVKLVVTATQASKVLIWNTFPTANDQAPDVTLTGLDSNGATAFGTPRTIGTDGTSYLTIGDHNAYPSLGGTSENFYWNSFPTQDTAWSFLLHDPWDGVGMIFGGWLTSNDHFVALAPPGIAIWDALPTTAFQTYDTFVGSGDGRIEEAPIHSTGYHFSTGDTGGIAIASTGQIYVSLGTMNMIVGYNSMPTDRAQLPDFAVGSTDTDTLTYTGRGYLDNPVPVSDGTFLLAISDFDHELAVWNAIPTQSGTAPSAIYDLGTRQLTEAALSGSTLVAAGLNENTPEIDVWTSMPPTSGTPDQTFSSIIGSVTLSAIGGLALDSQYLYVGDSSAGYVYVWSNLPDATTDPVYSFSASAPTSLSSDGTYLAVVDSSASSGEECKLYQVSSLSSSPTALVTLPVSGAGYSLQQPGSAHAYLHGGRLFLSDTLSGRVLVWSAVANAIAGNDPDVVLGQTDLTTTLSENVAQDKLFWPARMTYDGSRLWVGGYKFSGRLVAFNDDVTVNAQPNAVAVVSGSEQSAVSGSAFSKPLVVLVTDAYAQAVSGATVSFSGTGLTFVDGGTVTTGSDGLASITAAPSTTGALTATASVSGVTPSATFSLTGTASSTATPSFAMSATAITLTAGASSGNTSTVTVTPSNGFIGTVTLTAALASSPSGAVHPPSLSFGSTSVAITGTSAVTATLNVATTAPSTATTLRAGHLALLGSGPGGVGGVGGGAILFGGVLLWRLGARRRWLPALTTLLLIAAGAGGVMACGGGGSPSSGTTSTTTTAGTTAGTYTITVTGTSGSTVATDTVTLVVQ